MKLSLILFYIIIILVLLIASSCGFLMEVYLEPLEFEPTTSSERLEFRHVRQSNFNEFEGYHLFYKIFLRDTENENRVAVNNSNSAVKLEDDWEILLNDFNSKIRNNSGRLNNLINNFAQFDRYHYLLDIRKSDRRIDPAGQDQLRNQIPNNTVEYLFVIESSTGGVLDNVHDLELRNDTLDISQKYVLFRRFVDSGLNNEAFSRRFNWNELRGYSDLVPIDKLDLDLPPGINLDAGVNLRVAFFGIAHGFDPATITSLFSDASYLGFIDLDIL